MALEKFELLLQLILDRGSSSQYYRLKSENMFSALVSDCKSKIGDISTIQFDKSNQPGVTICNKWWTPCDKYARPIMYNRFTGYKTFDGSGTP